MNKRSAPAAPAAAAKAARKLGTFERLEALNNKFLQAAATSYTEQSLQVSAPRGRAGVQAAAAARPGARREQAACGEQVTCCVLGLPALRPVPEPSPA